MEVETRAKIFHLEIFTKVLWYPTAKTRHFSSFLCFKPDTSNCLALIPTSLGIFCRNFKYIIKLCMKLWSWSGDLTSFHDFKIKYILTRQAEVYQNLFDIFFGTFFYLWIWRFSSKNTDIKKYYNIVTIMSITRLTYILKFFTYCQVLIKKI